MVITVCSWCAPWGITESYALNLLVAWCPPSHSILWPQATTESSNLAQRVPVHWIFGAYPKEWADREDDQPVPESCREQHGSYAPSTRSTKRMLPHTRTVKFLKIYLECHGEIKLLLGENTVVHNSHTRFYKKNSVRESQGPTHKGKTICALYFWQKQSGLWIFCLFLRLPGWLHKSRTNDLPVFAPGQ